MSYPPSQRSPVRLLVLFALWMAAWSAVPAQRPMRGVWVEGQPAPLQSEAACRELMERLREVNAESVFVVVRRLADAYYESDIVPPTRSLPEDFKDPLRVLLEQRAPGGARPLRVHAVLDLLRVDSEDYPISSPPGHLRRDRPEWIMSNRAGERADAEGYLYLDPALPAVREHLARVVGELAGRYPLDGIHFHGLAYPGLDWGYSSETLRLYAVETAAEPGAVPAPQDPQWLRWRSRQLDVLLTELVAAAREADPRIALSASAIATGPLPEETGADRPADYQAALQNWPGWRERGLVDALLLLNHHPNQTASRRFVHWIDYARSIPGDTPLYVSISGRENFDSGVVMQMRLALSRNVEGVLLDSYQHPARNLLVGSDVLGYIGRTVFSPDYVLPEYLQDSIAAAAPPPREYAVRPISPALLPRPVPLDPGPEPTPTAPALDRGAPARALLGETLLVPEDEHESEVWTGEIPPEQEKALEKEKEILEPRWQTIHLRGGGHFVGTRVGGDQYVTRFRVRDSGIEISLRNGIILGSRPLE